MLEPHERALRDLRERRARQGKRTRKHRQKIARKLCATRRRIRLHDEPSRAHAEQAREHRGAAHEAPVGRAPGDRTHHAVTDLNLVRNAASRSRNPQIAFGAARELEHETGRKAIEPTAHLAACAHALFDAARECSTSRTRSTTAEAAASLRR